MAISQIPCPRCGRYVPVPDELLGTEVECPACRAAFPAELPEEEAEVVPDAEAIQPRPARRNRPPCRPADVEDKDFPDEGEEDDFPPRRGGRAGAKNAVLAPAVGLLVAGIFGMMLSAAVFPFSNPRPPGAQARPAPDPAESFGRLTGGLIIPVCWGGIVLAGAFQMINLRSYPSARAGAIVALIPCNACWLLGLPFGIWALVVLRRPEVKKAFRR